MRDENVIINGVSFNEIIDAISLLQKAGIDTSSVSMSLTHAIGNIEDKNLYNDLDGVVITNFRKGDDETT